MRVSIRNNSVQLRSEKITPGLTIQRSVHGISRIRRQVPRFSLPVPVLALAMAATTPASAGPNSDARIDLQLDRSVASLPAASTGNLFALDGSNATGPIFTLTLIVPGYYNSNPGQTGPGTSNAFESDPEADLGVKYNLKSFVLSGTVHSDFDRYVPNSSDAAADKAFAEANIAYNDPWNLSPSLDYTHTELFTPTYASRMATFDDFTGGIDKTFQLDSAWSLELVIDGQHRIKTPTSASPTPSSNALIVDPTLKVALSPRWNISVAPNVTGRWYDSYQALNGRDWLISPLLQVEYDPSNWSCATPKVDLQVNYVNQQSNRIGGTFHQWVVGPSISTKWTLGRC